MPHKHNHLFLSHCEAIHLRASILINITNCVLKQNDFWANSLPYAYRHVTRKHHVCGGNTEGDWTCIHQGEWLRCAMTNKHRDSPVPPLISPHDNNFKFTEIAETGSQDSGHILILIRGSVQSPKHISAVVTVEIQQPKACYPFHHVSISLCFPEKPHLFQCFASFALAHLESSVLPYWPSLDLEVINSTVRGRGKNLINTMTNLTSVENLAQIYKGSGC